MNAECQDYYSWHQSHDQATVLLMVPYETQPEDVVVNIEQSFLVAGVRGQPPVIKGRLYGRVDTNNSVWQLEPRVSPRERTTSTASTMSSQSSFAFVSDPEISSSFAASLALDSGHVSDNDEPIGVSEPASPRSPRSRDEQFGLPTVTMHVNASLPTSPHFVPSSMVSSFSSAESAHPLQSGRLLTLHLEKGESIIWPSLIIGPVPDSLSPIMPNPFSVSLTNEHKYNMDPTSLGTMAEDLLDIRKDKEEAFEYFVRAWHQGHTSLSTLRLVSHYLPPQSTTTVVTTPTPKPGTPEYYVRCIGGAACLGQLYLEAGLLHLEGGANLLKSSFATSRTISDARSALENGTEAWKRDREIARRYFDRARVLAPDLDVPVLASDGESEETRGRVRSQAKGPTEGVFTMPSMDLKPPAAVPGPSQRSEKDLLSFRPRRRRKDDEISEAPSSMVETVDGDEDNTWYLYLPGLIGAGTALLVVGVVSAIGFSTWRKNHN